jgi:hypothetical protein
MYSITWYLWWAQNWGLKRVGKFGKFELLDGSAHQESMDRRTKPYNRNKYSIIEMTFDKKRDN